MRERNYTEASRDRGWGLSRGAAEASDACMVITWWKSREDGEERGHGLEVEVALLSMARSEKYRTADLGGYKEQTRVRIAH